MNAQHVSISDLKFVYPDGTEAISGVNLSIGHGERIGLVGENGSGKTTLCKHMNGLLSPTSGRIFVDGTDVANIRTQEIAAKVGYLFQNPDHQIFCSSVAEEMSFGLKNIGLPQAEIERRVAGYMRLLGIEHLSNEPPLMLSIGERRLVTVASALAMEQELMILDEPVAWLDARQAKLVAEAMKEAGRSGRTIILITHNMKLVADLTDRLIVMSQGKTVYDGKTRDLVSDPEAMSRARLVSPPVTMLAESIKGASGMPRKVATVQDFVSWMEESRKGGGAHGPR